MKVLYQTGFYKLITLLAAFVILPGCDSVRVGVTHWNDISGQIESFERGLSTGEAPAPCPNRAEAVFKCIGGLRSLAHWLNDSTVYGDDVLPENILRLSSGNLIGWESGWISPVDGGWEKYGKLVKKHFRPHVTTLGMKEFGAGLGRTMDYIHGLGAKHVTLANTCYQNQSSLYGKEEKEFCEEYAIDQRIQIVNIMDAVKYVQVKVGVIGFVDPFVERLSLPGKLKFTPIVPTIEQVVQHHKNEVGTFVVIGDGSLQIAKEILDKIPQVKLVIYASGDSGDKDASKGGKTYPIVYKHGYIATAGHYGSTIGNLIFDLDTDTGAFHLVPGRSKLIETSRPEIWNAAAQDAQTDYTKLEAGIRKMKDSSVGQSRVNLQSGRACWRQECNLGNLVADAIVHCALQLPSKPFDFHLHSIFHAGGLFDGNVKASGKISKFDIRKWLPQHNWVHLISVKGRNLRRIFEASATALNPVVRPSRDGGQFLQISNGFEVSYNSQSASLVRIRMTLDENGIPQLTDLVDQMDYYLVIPTFLYEGRGVYEFAREKGFWKDVIFDNMTKSNFAFDDDCMEGYIKVLGQVSVGFEERIWVNENSNARFGYNYGMPTGLIVTLAIIVFVISQAVAYAGYKYVMPLVRQRFSILREPTGTTSHPSLII